MPTFQITSPDGIKYRVTGPEGATEQDALSQIQSRQQGQTQQDIPADTFVGPDLPPAVDIKNLAPDLPWYAAAAAAGLPGDIASLIGLGGKKYSPPTSADLRAQLDAVSPLYAPGTIEGKMLKGASENLLGAVGPGGLIAKGAQVVLPAIASELAGSATEGTAAEPYARAAAGFGAGLGAGTAAAGSRAARAIPALEQAQRVTPQEVITGANQQYQAIRDSGATVPATEMPNFAAQARNALVTRFSEANAPAVYRELGRLDNVPPGATTTAGDVLNLRQRLSEIAKETQDFRSTPQAAAAQSAKRELDTFLELSLIHI